MEAMMNMEKEAKVEEGKAAVLDTGKKKRGRRTMNATVRDKVGEPVDLGNCPCCTEHPDCFAWMEGKCTALKEYVGANCVFYKPEQQAVKEAQESYQKLVKENRYDLINKYGKALEAMGAMSAEFEGDSQLLAEFEQFQKEDMEAQLAESGVDTSAVEETADQNEC